LIRQVIENWHLFVQGKLPGGLDELLAQDVVFYSPVVFTPQKGKEMTKFYLAAAGSTFGGDKTENTPGSPTSNFRYVKEVLSGNCAVLEFESEVDGKYVNGVDIITCNDRGKIIEFKVMIRPLQAVNVMHQQMKETLEKMQAESG